MSPLFTPAKALILLAIVLAGLLVAYKLSQDSTNNAAPAKAAAASAQVSLTSSGFSPLTISMEAGSQLTWINNDTSPHQVAADPYPKNDSIPGFNSSQVLQPGDSYTFTFTTVGTYHMHDQLNPLKPGGTVVVD